MASGVAAISRVHADQPSDRPDTNVSETVPAVPVDSDRFHLFILAGQSNMAGRGQVTDADRQPHPRVLSLGKDGNWGLAVDPLHFDKPAVVGVGVGRSFAIAYAERHPGVTVGLIPCAVGGSSIDTWQPGGYHAQTHSHPWDDMQSRVQHVVGQGVLKGVLWHQGESDSNDSSAAVYEARLKDLIERFRMTFAEPQLPFLIGQLGQFAERPWNDARRAVDAAQQRTTQHVARTAFVPSDGLTDKGDSTHFDARSLREFGVRYAAAMQWIESRVPVKSFPPGVGNPRNSEGDFVRLASGRMLYVYTKFESGTSDHASATLVSRCSDDMAATWSDDDVTVIENEGDMNVMSVSLLRMADGRIALFYLQKNSLTDCRPVVRFSTDEAKTWSEPTQIIPDAQQGYYVLNNDRVIQMSSGRLIVPVALHRTPDQAGPDWHGKVGCYYSDDGGIGWKRSESLLIGRTSDGVRVKAQEPGVVERQDGSLLMWVRSDQGTQYQSSSSDGGCTWSSLQPLALSSPLSPASIERIPATGDLVAVWNDHSHQDVPSSVRTPLSLAISKDDGETWSGSIPIAADPTGWYCYTAIDWADDSLLLAYVAGRQGQGRELTASVITQLPLAEIYSQLSIAGN